MAWIEVHQSLPSHRKTLALADFWGIPAVHVTGHLVTLWLWSVDNALGEGFIGASDRVIAAAAQWSGDPTVFVNALVAAGFLDRSEDGLTIHDWPDYLGKLLLAREVNAEKQRQWRARHPRASHTNEERNDNVTSDVTVTSPTMSPLRSGTTVPNRTQPNRTNQIARGDANAGDSQTRATAPSTSVLEKTSQSLSEKPLARKMWDALGAIVGYTPTGRRAVERGAWNAAIASMTEAGETAQSLESLAKAYREDMPEMLLTVPALAKHCQRLRAKVETPLVVYDGPLFRGGYSKEEADEAERKEAAKYKPPLVVVTPEGMQKQDHRVDLAAMTQQLASRPPIQKNGPPASGLKRPTYDLGKR